MAKPKHHILVCCSFRGTEAKGKCIKKDSINFVPYIEEELADRGVDAIVSSTGCLKYCEEGPVMIVYPEAYWYKNVANQGAIDDILDALENGQPAKKYLMA